MGSPQKDTAHGLAESIIAPKITPSTPVKLNTATKLIVPLSPLDYRRMSPRAEERTKRPKKAAGTRKRLFQYHSFNDAVDLLKGSKNIVVLTGAGISTSVGIPDFRSDKGLYNQLSHDLGITSAEEFFSKQYFIHNPAEFFGYVKRVIPESIPLADGYYRAANATAESRDQPAAIPKYTPTHAFLSFLSACGKLLTNYTQNIDGLERAAGLPQSKFVQCHGSWDSATCLTCGKKSAAKRYLPVIFSGGVPHCKCSLEETSKPKSSKSGHKRKRQREEWDSDHSSDDNTAPPKGLLKPDITFFEDRITPYYDERLEIDKSRIDLLIIIGTSLKVAPVQNMLYEISPTVPQIYISKERFSGALCSLPGVQVDIELLGECDVIIQELCRRAGWQSELRRHFWQDGLTRTTENTLQSPSIINRQTSSNLQERKRAKLTPDPFSQHTESATKSSKVVTDTPRSPFSDIASAEHLASGLRHDATSLVDAKAATPTLKTPTTEMQPSHNDLEQDDFRVKIDLVEGTSHQWTVRRQK